VTSVLLSWYYQLKSTDSMSINLADELVNKQLVILLMFVNNEHFVNAVTMGRVSHVDKMRMQTMREQGFEAKAIIRAYTHINNGN